MHRSLFFRRQPFIISHPQNITSAPHHSVASCRRQRNGGGGIFTRTLDGVRPGGDAHIPAAEWIIPNPPRGSVAAGIGAARAKRSTADSPTATAGSRAAQIKPRTIFENVIFLMILWPKM